MQAKMVDKISFSTYISTMLSTYGKIKNAKTKVPKKLIVDIITLINPQITPSRVDIDIMVNIITSKNVAVIFLKYLNQKSDNPFSHRGALWVFGFLIYMEIPQLM